MKLQVPHFILASCSPRREHLLRQIQLPFQKIPPSIQENLLPKEEPIKAVVRLSQEKANFLNNALLPKKTLVIAADTLVISPQKKIFGKPKNSRQATLMLQELSGKPHTVITGYCLILYDNAQVIKKIKKTVSSQVTFRKLSNFTLQKYIRTQEPLDKAGAYGAQSIGMGFIKSIQGSYTNVIGLPIEHLVYDFEKHFHIPFLSWLQ